MLRLIWNPGKEYINLKSGLGLEIGKIQRDWKHDPNKVPKQNIPRCGGNMCWYEVPEMRKKSKSFCIFNRRITGNYLGVPVIHGTSCKNKITDCDQYLKKRNWENNTTRYKL